MQRTRAALEYEFRTVRFTRETTRNEAKQALTEAAEYGRWELARTRIGMGGVRTYWLRRRTMKVARTA